MIGRGEDTLTDAEVVRRIRVGDEAALAWAYDRYARPVHALATRVCRDSHASEDVTQQVFLHLWTRPETFDPARCTLRGWLLMLAHRRAVDWIRSEVRRRLPPLEEPTLPSAEDEAIESMMVDLIGAAVDQLSPNHREVVRMLYYEELSVAEIAERLGIPPGTTKTRLFRARQKLAALLDQLGTAAAT